MGTEDFARFGDLFRNEIDNLDDDPAIDEDDRDAIHRFVRDRSSLEESSLREYVCKLRLSARRTDTPLVEHDQDGIEALLFEFGTSDEYGRGGGGMSDKSVRNYETALVQFYRFLDRGWADDFDYTTVSRKPVDPEEMLTAEDIAKLTDAAKHPRDAALVEFLADTGARRTLVGSLRIRDVTLDQDTATYRPNPDAKGLKGATIQPYPIIDSKAALRAYKEHSHPRPDEPTAAFFHRRRDFGPIDEDDGALSSSHLWSHLQGIAERAGVSKPVNPHNFRHSAVTRMYREGYTKPQIQHRVHWTVDTDMWDTYVHLEAEDMNEGIFADAGVVDDAGDSEQLRRPCSECREPIPLGREKCPNCGMPTTKEGRDLLKEALRDLRRTMVDADDADFREMVFGITNSLEDNPGRLSDGHSVPSKD